MQVGNSRKSDRMTYVNMFYSTGHEEIEEVWEVGLLAGGSSDNVYSSSNVYSSQLPVC